MGGLILLYQMTFAHKKMILCVKLISINHFAYFKLSSVKPEPSLNDVPLTGAPSVDLLHSTMPIEPIKSTIGVRKIQPKRGGVSTVL